VVGGSSLMSSAWRATGVVFPVASVSVTVMWSVLCACACADSCGAPMTTNVANNNARLMEPSSAAGEPKSTSPE
jgi:hypothetical protein